jgi:hypothetical protein
MPIHPHVLKVLGEIGVVKSILTVAWASYLYLKVSLGSANQLKQIGFDTPNASLNYVKYFHGPVRNCCII